MRELGSGNESIVLNTHLVVVFITFLQTAQNADGILHTWLVHHDSLESAFECLVLFEILLVFFQCGGSDGSDFAT